jgi:hypothetical protein
MNLRYTKHQVARGTRADAEDNNRLFLIKAVSMLRLTYQIQLLTYLACESHRKLVIQVPFRCSLHWTLRNYINDHSSYIVIKRV